MEDIVPNELTVLILLNVIEVEHTADSDVERALYDISNPSVAVQASGQGGVLFVEPG